MPKICCEQWRPIPGYEGLYEVSNLGRVRSLARIVAYADGRRKPIAARILRPGRAGRERCYLFVQLSRDGKAKGRYIHDLVLLAFVGPKPAGMLVKHGPNGSADNGLANLSYGTDSENQHDRRRDGTGNHRRVRRADGVEYTSVMEAAKANGVGHSVISRALNEKRRRAAGFAWEYAHA
jgi:hypothetical protein